MGRKRSAPSPWAHVHRLLVLLVIFGIVFLIIRDQAIPESWDFERWYRSEALTLLKDQPTVFGGNESCTGSSCHQDERYLVDDAKAEHRLRLEKLRWATHATLSCESCHGPLAEHVQNGLKIEKATLIKDSSLCLRCHEDRLGRGIAPFDASFKLHEAKDVTQDSRCIDCHNPHEPK